MTYIGIALVEVFTMVSRIKDTCATGHSCFAVIQFEDVPLIEKRAIYLGRFETNDECDKASRNRYVLAPGEAFVEPQMTEALCVPASQAGDGH